MANIYHIISLISLVVGINIGFLLDNPDYYETIITKELINKSITKEYYSEELEKECYNYYWHITEEVKNQIQYINENYKSQTICVLQKIEETIK